MNIIRQRVDGSGVSEAEVTTQSGNIVVTLPGRPDQRTRDLVKQSAQLQFRSVLVAAAGTNQPVTPTPTGSASPSGSPGASPSAKKSAKPAASAKSSATRTSGATATSSGNGRAVPPVAGLSKASSATPTGAPSPPAGSGAAPATTPKDASDPAWVTPALEQRFTQLDCADPQNRAGNSGGDLTKPFVTCSTDGTEKYILGPAEVIGTDIKTAAAGLQQNSQGNATGQWEVQLSFTGAGTTKFAAVTSRLAALTGDRNRFAIVLDGTVISAPTTNERIPDGQAPITGNFNQSSAQTLANQLKFGALPISFRVETEEQISALLGGEQLRRGLLAGVIGLLLVIIYSLLQYRALGLVTVGSLGVAGLVTYGLVLLLCWRQGYRLSLPGVAGLIVAIGITADSFIVYFERIRDEVRDGRPLLPAVEAAWERARRTILVSDGVSLLAAVVLYLLAVGGVRGFAFTLGLTTIVDILIVFMFTKPTVTLLARTSSSAAATGCPGSTRRTWAAASPTPVAAPSGSSRRGSAAARRLRSRPQGGPNSRPGPARGSRWGRASRPAGPPSGRPPGGRPTTDHTAADPDSQTAGTGRDA